MQACFQFATPTAGAPECVGLGSEMRGRWIYSTVDLYRATTRDDGSVFWKRASQLGRFRSPARAARVAELEALTHAIRFDPAVRHGHTVTAGPPAAFSEPRHTAAGGRKPAAGRE